MGVVRLIESRILCGEDGEFEVSTAGWLILLHGVLSILALVRC